MKNYFHPKKWRVMFSILLYYVFLGGCEVPGRSSLLCRGMWWYYQTLLPVLPLCARVTRCVKRDGHTRTSLQSRLLLLYKMAATLAIALSPSAANRMLVWLNLVVWLRLFWYTALYPPALKHCWHYWSHWFASFTFFFLFVVSLYSIHFFCLLIQLCVVSYLLSGLKHSSWQLTFVKLLPVD